MFNRIKPIKKDQNYQNKYILTLAVKVNGHKNYFYQDAELLCVETKSAPVKGKANKAIIKMLKKALEISKSSIFLVKGHTSTTKIFEIRISNVNSDKIRKKLLNFNK